MYVIVRKTGLSTIYVLYTACTLYNIVKYITIPYFIFKMYIFI